MQDTPKAELKRTKHASTSSDRWQKHLLRDAKGNIQKGAFQSIINLVEFAISSLASLCKYRVVQTNKTSNADKSSASPLISTWNSFNDSAKSHPSRLITSLGLLFYLLGYSNPELRPDFTSLGLLLLFFGGIGLLGSGRARKREMYKRAGIDSIRAMSGTDFEHLLVSLFRDLGYKVTHTGGKGDFGADLIIEKDGQRTAIQAKCYNGKVRHDAVQEVVAAKAHYNAKNAMVITPSEFSAHAKHLADSNYVTLWDQTILSEQLSALSKNGERSTISRFASEVGYGYLEFFKIIIRIGIRVNQR